MEYYEMPLPSKGVNQFRQWIVSFRSPKDIWENNPFLLLFESGVILTAILFLYLAKHGEKITRYRTIVCVVSALTIELSSLVFPQIRSWWYEHPMITFFGCRLPLYVASSYVVLFHMSTYLSRMMNLPRLAEACFSGILVFICLLPADILAAHNVLWQWHDFDPSWRDRFYFVPWTELLGIPFHAVTSILLTDLYYKGDSKNQSSVVLICSGLLCALVHALQYTSLYHIVSVFPRANTDVLGLVILGLFGSIVWTADRNNLAFEIPRRQSPPFKKIIFAIFILGMCVLPFLAFMIHPENVRSFGPHLPSGKCDIQEFVITPKAIPVTRGKYYCLTASEFPGAHSVECIPKKDLESITNRTTEWYPICGKPVTNRANMFFVLASNSYIGITLLYNINNIKIRRNVNGEAKKIT